MAAIMFQTIPSFYAKNSEKNLFISADTYEKNLVCKDYCIALHDDQTCFLPVFKYHIILLGEIEELLHKLDTFCFTHQHVDCLYILFKYRFREKINVNSGNVFDNVQRAITFNQRNRGVEKMLSILKRGSWEKFKQHFMSALRKNNSTQTSGSMFAEWIEKAKKTKFELELIKIVDCFFDGQGNYDSNIVSFRKKSLEQTIFFITVSKRTQKKNKMPVKNEIPCQKISSNFGFQNNIFKTCQNL